MPADPHPLKMTDVTVGMKLRDPNDYYFQQEGVLTVTEITPRGFKYDAERDVSLGPRHGTVLAKGKEHFGIDGICRFIPLRAEPGPAPSSQNTEELVYLVDGGDYSNYGWSGVYQTLEAAMAAHPLPEMRAIQGEQTDPTFELRRPGGWLPVERPRCPDGEWWNGFSSDFGYHIHAVRIAAVASSSSTPTPDQEPT